MKIDQLLNAHYHAEGAADASPKLSLAEVRAGVTTIPGNKTTDFAEERDER